MKNDCRLDSKRWKSAHSIPNQSHEESLQTQTEVKVPHKENAWIASWNNKKNTTDNTKKRCESCCCNVSRKSRRIAGRGFTQKRKAQNLKAIVYSKDFSKKIAHYPLTRWKDHFLLNLSTKKRDLWAQSENLTTCTKMQTIKSNDFLN